MTTVQVALVSPEQVLDRLTSDLGLEPRALENEGLVLIGTALRRVCGFLCPCSPHQIVAAARQSLERLPGFIDLLEDRLSDALEQLAVGGDVLELARVTMADAADKPTWIFCASPSFVRRGERIYLFGIAVDDAPFLPSSLQERVRYDGLARYIAVNSDEDLESQLCSFGLRRVAAEAWLSSPRLETASDYVARVTNCIDREGVAGDIPELVIIRQAAREERRSYQARWTPPGQSSGLLVGRAPQAYGAPLWYACLAEQGRVLKSINLPFADEATRACDAAWRIQLAIDSAAGSPATYTLSDENGGTRLTLDFPIPLAEARRLCYLGATVIHATQVFWIQPSQLEAATALLNEGYWFQQRAT